jgi:hypothetical protein
MKTYGEVDVQIHVLLISVLVGGEWSASRRGHFTPGGKSPRTGVDDVERTKILPLTGLEFRPLGRPARSQSLYRLRYPGSLY